jgi:Undecaprenyl-phosphate galactose phosphotransferase WbaP
VDCLRSCPEVLEPVDAAFTVIQDEKIRRVYEAASVEEALLREIVVDQRFAAAQLTLVPNKHQQLRAVRKGLWKVFWQRWLVPSVLALSDVSLALLSWEVAFVLQGAWGRGTLSQIAIVTMVPVIGVWVGLRTLLGLYPGYALDTAEQLRRHTNSVFVTLAMLAILALGLHIGDLLSRLLLTVMFLSLLILGPFVRYFVQLWIRRIGLWGKPVLVLGYREAGTSVVSILKENWELGYDPVAVLDYRLDAAESSFEGEGDQRVLDAAVSLARQHGVDTAIFAMPYIRREQLTKLVDVASLSFKRVVVIPNLGGITNSTVVARDFAGTFGVEIHYNLLDPWARRVKRVFDLLGAVTGGLLVSPILLTLFVLIRLDSRGPALFVQERPGQDGNMFRIFKFRTMYTDAEQRFEQLVLKNPLAAKEFANYGKLRDDPRVTRVGKWVRRFSLDELPQLWNVLKGEMSLVGPRPYLIDQVIQLEGAGGVISRVLPGVTGLWQVSGRSDITFEQRVDLDTHYVRNWSIWLDLVILARTAKIVLFSRGAY